MNYRLVAKMMGLYGYAIGAVFLPSILWALYYKEWETIPGFLYSILVSCAVGVVLRLLGRNASPRFFQREALAVVALSWVLTGILGALPYIFNGVLHVVPAIFESVSGFSTTGASVIDDVEAVPKGVLFWRALTHWLGGIGIIVLYIAVLPYLGAGGKQLFKSESSIDPRALRPRIKESALILLGIYSGLTTLEIIALLCTGQMNLFEAMCHSFATLATGGFSTRNLSVGAYNSIAVEVVIMIFMISGASSFLLYFNVLKGRWNAFFEDMEWRTFISILGVSTLLIALNVSGLFGGPDFHPSDVSGNPPVAHAAEPTTFAHALREAAFNATSLMTNTGFMADDFDYWPFFSRMLLIALMTLGGCAGSTCGGMKIVRIIIVMKMIAIRIGQTFRPKTVYALRVGGEVVSDIVQQRSAVFVLTYLLCLAVCSLCMSAFGLPFDAAVSSVATCMSGTGPGLGLVGGIETYSFIPYGGQLFLCFCMILGRLELFSLLVLFAPGFWRLAPEKPSQDTI